MYEAGLRGWLGVLLFGGCDSNRGRAVANETGAAAPAAPDANPAVGVRRGSGV